MHTFSSEKTLPHLDAGQKGAKWVTSQKVRAGREKGLDKIDLVCYEHTG
jgi:hypothetical protein